MRFSICISLVLLPATLVAFTGCNTAIESTRAIKMSKEDRRLAQPTREDATAAAIKSEPAIAWRIGKPFLIADNKATLVYEFPSKSMALAGDSISVKGKILKYAGKKSRPTPGGSETAVLEFDGPDGRWAYNTGCAESALTSYEGADLPMLIDLEMVNLADSLLRGRKIWTLSTLWYDKYLNSFTGKKFVPVIVTNVTPGNMLFPLLVNFVDNNGNKASMYMNVASNSSNGSESRTYPSLFTETDPKIKYPNISQENWQLICSGKVGLGMTKQECRLALGNPADVLSGHDWDSLRDVWSYKNGTYLRFQDDILVDFRQ